MNSGAPRRWRVVARSRRYETGSNAEGDGPGRSPLSLLFLLPGNAANFLGFDAALLFNAPGRRLFLARTRRRRVLGPRGPSCLSPPHVYLCGWAGLRSLLARPPLVTRGDVTTPLILLINTHVCLWEKLKQSTPTPGIFHHVAASRNQNADRWQLYAAAAAAVG